MPARSTLAALLVLLLAATSPADDKEKKPEGDLGKVQGKWTARYGPNDIPITIEVKGEDVTAVITNDNGEMTLKGRLKIDDKAKPHKTVDWLDFKLPNGDDAQENLAIYELNAKGDEWKVCNGGAGKPRPTEFKEGDNGDDPHLIVFKRPKDGQ
ncbi:MAG TPA: TIGR03067 domain-containing protein [Isosphaeraceae bacterium]|jgi:uncharacterized protein (TIGR03067 family)|nr:TIGR03067 domain-containing protein [Isosphaeraceae bacterium]